MTINQQDLSSRLAIINQYISNSTIKLLNKIKIGSPDLQCKVRDLEVLTHIYKYIKCYDVTILTNNCYTGDQLHIIFDYISKKYKLVFAPYGYKYS